MATLKEIQRWEDLWKDYVEKLQRLEDLRRMGRYGYQLRMPQKTLKVAREALIREFPDEVRFMCL